jgi:hypothetical protein
MPIQEVPQSPATARLAAQSAAASKSGSGSVKPGLCGLALEGADIPLFHMFTDLRHKFGGGGKFELVQRLSAAGQAFAEGPASETLPAQPEADLSECPDADLDLKVIATPAATPPDGDGSYPEDWGTLLGTGGFCPS